jgi:thiol-disulfide isomerase/thioredoxin
MVKFLFLALLIQLPGANSWHYDLTEAEQLARQDHRHIILNFSGADWCGPCIRMHKEIFESQAFTQMADSQLVLVNADFPRMKKNQLSKKQQDLNNAMADKYNPEGKFPLTLLLTEDGKVIRAWDGLPNMTAEAFTAQVREIITNNK